MRREVSASCSVAIESNRHQCIGVVGTSRVISRCYTLLANPPSCQHTLINGTSFKGCVGLLVNAGFSGSVKNAATIVDKCANEWYQLQAGNTH